MRRRLSGSTFALSAGLGLTHRGEQQQQVPFLSAAPRTHIVRARDRETERERERERETEGVGEGGGRARHIETRKDSQVRILPFSFLFFSSSSSSSLSLSRHTPPFSLSFFHFLSLFMHRFSLNSLHALFRPSVFLSVCLVRPRRSPFFQG